MIIKGTIKRLNVLNGKMKKKLHGLKIQILPVNTFAVSEIKPVHNYNAKWNKGLSFGGIVKRLNAIFRFLSTKDRIIQKHKAKAISAPVVDVQVDSTFQTGKEAPLSAHPAKGIAVNHKEWISVSVKLSAYIRAGCRYIKKLFFKTTARLKAASSAVTKYTETLKFKRKAKAIAVGSEIIKSRFNKVQTGFEATGSSAPAHTVPAIENTFSAEHTATASTGTAVALIFDPALNVSTMAKLNFAWEVFFMTHIGKELYSCLVNMNANCPDPVAAGLIEEPTRESDAQWHYVSFVGWSRTQNGDADETALQNVTKALTLYPAFDKELRYYTISFYDVEEIIHTMSVAYGDTPSYTPTKSGFRFVGWTPELAPVTGEAAYGAIWVSDYLASGDCGESVTWVLTKTGDLIISGNGAMTDLASESDQPWYAYVTEIKTITVESGVSRIGDRAFIGCTNLISVTIAEGVTTIGRSAFYNCSNLPEITLPNTLTGELNRTFYGCAALSSITIPNGVTSIGDYAFYNCAALSKVTIPDSVTSIGDYAFTNCTSVCTELDGSLKYLTLPDNITRIGKLAFQNCTGFVSVTLPLNLTYIGKQAFYKCKNTLFTSIRIPGGVTVIGAYAFGETSIKEMSFNGRGAYQNWYRCSSETSTSGTRMNLSTTSSTALAKYFVSTYTGYWFKVL